MTLRVGSLFSGIGGLDLGLERAGMTVTWQAEVDPYCCQVLNKHWPHVPNLGDVKAIDWAEVPRVDVIAGGYPCQPFSTAGRRQGDADPRHLWPYMWDALRVLRPRFALMENVSGHLALGFGRVLGDLAEIGYDAEWDCIPAVALGAPHRRDRVFIVAYPQRDELRQQSVAVPGCGGAPLAAHDGPQGLVADPTGGGEAHQPDGCDAARQPIGTVPGAGRGARSRDHAAGDRVFGRGARVLADDVADAHRQGREDVQGRPADAEQPGARTAGGAGWWRVEPDVGRVVDGVRGELDPDRLRALGNAVVPQVAEHVGRLILGVAA